MRVIALVKRILLQIRRDKRTLALLFFAPLLVLTLMNFVFNGNEIKPELGVVGANKPLIEQLEAADIIVKPYEEVADIKDTVKENKLDGLLQLTADSFILTVTNDNPTIAKMIEMKVKQLLQLQAQPSFEQAEATNQLAIQTDYIYGSSETVSFDTFSPILIGYFVFFFVFLISGIGLLNERTTGTLERLMATPIRRFEIIAGYLISYGILAFIQTIIIVLFSIHVLDIILVGSIWDVLFINIITALLALSLGILLSSFASSEFQMIQFIPLVIVPQIFFSGIFPLEGMADWLQGLAYIMPLYYVAEALKGIMYMGLGLSDVVRPVLILVAFIVCFIILNLFALKKYRKL